MELKEFIKKAKEIDDKYTLLNKHIGNRLWELSEYTQGFVGDVGDLCKLVMAKNRFRKKEDVDKKLSEELSDCLWSIIMIADKLAIDLEKDFFVNMDELDKKISN
ncbi:MAG: nucleotide pyrophosphohydrolase [Patescibacteria group bacterium]|jgi:hypothetical protein